MSSIIFANKIFTASPPPQISKKSASLIMIKNYVGCFVHCIWMAGTKKLLLKDTLLQDIK